MWKSGTFDLEDINQELIDEIVFFYISYPVMGDAGCVMFITESGNEYIIGQEGTDWHVDDIVKLFPEMYEAYEKYEAYENRRNAIIDENRFKEIGNWKITPSFGGVFLVRKDYFDKFYSVYQTENGFRKECPWGSARTIFGREWSAPKERMVYVKTQECWDRDEQRTIARQREIEENRLEDTDVPWLKHDGHISEGYIKFWIRKNDDGTLSAYRWYIQVQKEQYEEGSYGIEPQIECYNLFLQKYEDLNVEAFEEFENYYSSYVLYQKRGDFVRSYSTLDKAKAAVAVRNEWIGWGNVNKKNLYMLDYNHLKKQVEADGRICIF